MNDVNSHRRRLGLARGSRRPARMDTHGPGPPACSSQQPGPDSVASPLRRVLGLAECTLLGVGVILGAGIYALIGKAAGMAGNAVWLAFVGGAAVATFTGLSYAELAAMIPRSGGDITTYAGPLAAGSRLRCHGCCWSGSPLPPRRSLWGSRAICARWPGCPAWWGLRS
jgi:hypothetical protein